MFDIVVSDDECLRAENPLPQDSTACLRLHHTRTSRFLRPEGRCTDEAGSVRDELVSVPPLSSPRETFARDGRPGRTRIEAPDAP